MAQNEQDRGDDLFSYFYEEARLEREAEVLIEREKAKILPSSDGTWYPVITLDGLSETEKAVVKRHLMDKMICSL